MKIQELLEGDVVRFPRRHRNDPLNTMHRALTGRDLPAEPREPTYRNGVSVVRTPRGWEVFVNGENPDPFGYTFDNPERAHEEAAELQATLDES